jgi:hypothetical protein
LFQYLTAGDFSCLGLLVNQSKKAVAKNIEISQLLIALCITNSIHTFILPKITLQYPDAITETIRLLSQRLSNFTYLVLMLLLTG